jgi:hypothetical protein
VTGTVASIDASVSSRTNGRERLEFVSVVTWVWQLVAFPLSTIEPGCQNEGTVSVWAAMLLPPCRTSVVTPPQGDVETVGLVPSALYSVYRE